MMVRIFIGGTPFAQTSSGNGFTMDIGIMAPLRGNIYAGVNFENVFGIMWWENYDFDQLPFGIRTGLGYIAGTFNLLVDWHKKFYRFGNILRKNFGFKSRCARTIGYRNRRYKIYIWCRNKYFNYFYINCGRDI